jgi:hypothetical protein
VSFDEATTVFKDPFALTFDDPERLGDETGRELVHSGS